MSGKNPSGLSSYSYEVTFGTGTLGINLQATRSGKGTASRAKLIEILIASQVLMWTAFTDLQTNLYFLLNRADILNWGVCIVHIVFAFFIVMLCSDIVLAINDDDVSDLPLSELPKVIERAKRPITMKLERGNMELAFSDVVRDPRKVSEATCGQSIYLTDIAAAPLVHAVFSGEVWYRGGGTRAGASFLLHCRCLTLSVLSTRPS
jgi:hypothetical protein